jgi:hypothetical protein
MDKLRDGEVWPHKMESWNFSPTIFFGRSPKLHIVCGDCLNYFSTRVDMAEIEMHFPRATCPYCHSVNVLPLEVGRLIS